MSLNEIKFLANWAKSNALVTNILSSKLSCTSTQINSLLDDLILTVDKESQDLSNDTIKGVQPIQKLTFKKR